MQNVYEVSVTSINLFETKLEVLCNQTFVILAFLRPFVRVGKVRSKIEHIGKTLVTMARKMLDSLLVLQMLFGCSHNKTQLSFSLIRDRCTTAKTFFFAVLELNRSRDTP